MDFTTLTSLKTVFSAKNTRLVLLAVFTVLVLLLSYARVFERYELQTYDWRFSLRGERPYSDDIVLIDISDDTLATLGRWPFDREYHAALIQVLSEYKAKALVFDVEFVEPHNQDDKVIQATKAAKNVYFAFGFSSPIPMPHGKFFSKKIEAKLLPAYEEAARGAGFVNAWPDVDGKRRRVMPVIDHWGKNYYQLSFRVLMDVLGARPEDTVFKPGRYFQFSKDLRVPLDENGCFLINYAGLWEKSFQHYSYVDILSSYGSVLSGEKPIVDLNKLHGKICFVGLTAQGTHDSNPNPLQTVYPGVGTYANIVNTVLQKDFIRRLDRRSNLLLLIFIALCTAWVSFYKKPYISFLYTLATLTIFMTLVINLFIYAGIWVDLFYPVTVIILVYGAGTLTRIIREAQKRELMESELKIASQIQQSFLPPALPTQKGMQVAVYMKPAKAVGGDLYAFVPLPDNKIGIMVGDVSGKGTPAALFMGKVVSEFKFSARDRTNPAEVLSKLNDSIASESTGGLFVTLTYAIFDMKNKKVVMSNGGHLPVVVARPGKRSELLTAESGMPIGVMEGAEFANYECPIQAGEYYAFYSDGISEARNRKKEEYDVAQLQRVLLEHWGKPAQAVLDNTIQDIGRFTGKAEQHDDMTLILVQTTNE